MNIPVSLMARGSKIRVRRTSLNGSPRRAGEQHSQDRRTRVVEPAFAGLGKEWQGAEVRDPRVRVGLHIGIRLAQGGQVQRFGRLRYRHGVRCRKQLARHPKSEGEGQKVAQ